MEDKQKELGKEQEQGEKPFVYIENLLKGKKRKKPEKPEKPETTENPEKPEKPEKPMIEFLNYAKLTQKTHSIVKRGLVSPPVSSEALQSWYAHYTYGLCGTNSAMRFTIVLDGVDPTFPRHKSSFWAKWIPIVQGVVDHCPPPFGKELVVQYLERHEGGFEFVCKNQSMWKDWIFPDLEVGQHPDRVQIRVKGHERIGSASLITFAAQENCPLVIMMGFLKACMGLRVRVVEVENMPDGYDPIWHTHRLFEPFELF